METISRNKLREMIEHNEPFALVEVLGPKAYEASHLPGAMNIPLNSDFASKVEQAIPDRGHPVVVYCKDEDCDASPKAAAELERIGYQNVLDYAAGKDDWQQAGLAMKSSNP